MAARAVLQGGHTLPDDEDKQRSFEREKWTAEQALREREVAAKEREQIVHETEIKRARWSSPLFVAIVAATLALIGNGVLAWFNGRQGRQLEDARAESTRILEMIKTGDADKAAENLRFLADAGLISDPQRLNAIRQFLATRPRGQGPSLPSPSGGSVVQPTRIPEQSDRITQLGIWEGPIATFRDEFATTINEGYSIQEQWPKKLKVDRVAVLPQISKFFCATRATAEEYVNYHAIIEALTYPNERLLLDATNEFCHAIESLPATLPPDFDTKVVSSSGALGARLKLVQGWHSALQHAVTQNIENLTRSN